MPRGGLLKGMLSNGLQIATTVSKLQRIAVLDGSDCHAYPKIRGVRLQGEIRFAVVLPRRADATRLRSHIDVIKWQ